MPHIFLYIILLVMPSIGLSDNTQLNDTLPSIGNSSSALVTIREERRLGEAWLRSLRRNTQRYYNPILNEYLTNLIYKLAPYSEVSDKDFTLTVIDSPALNAFAVPGSIIGINAGLLVYTHSEHELASVLAHELAHLEQRHYARQLEQQKTLSPLTLAGMLASAIIMATAGSEAGVAALASTQALSIDKQLRFSRKNEQEADRIGLKTLYQSGFNPTAMPDMFERMYKESRQQGDAIPEYLSTHPLSDTRITDTKNRAEQYTREQRYPDNLNFQFCRTMILSDYSENKALVARNFERHIESQNQFLRITATFGLAYSLLEVSPTKSLHLLKKLREFEPSNIFIEITYAKALYNAGEQKRAVSALETLLSKNPENYAVGYYLADLYFKTDQIDKAEKRFAELSKQYPNDPDIWYQLAEVQGVAGNIVSLHQSRAEYFYLNNQLDRAIEQLNLAIKKANNDLTSSKIQNRLSVFYNEKKHPLF